MKTFIFDQAGERLKVWAHREGAQIWFHIHGETYVVTAEEGEGLSPTARGSRSTHPGKLLAPMPGKVTKVFATVGMPVTQGQPLLVMEAMKMEYTLSADGDGVVNEVNVESGQQVALGKLLISVEIAE